MTKKNLEKIAKKVILTTGLLVGLNIISYKSFETKITNQNKIIPYETITQGPRDIYNSLMIFSGKTKNSFSNYIFKGIQYSLSGADILSAPGRYISYRNHKDKS